MPSGVIDLHICIYMRVSSYQSVNILAQYIDWAAQPAAVAAEPTQFSGLADSPVLLTGRWLEVTWPPLCFKLGRGFATLSRQTLLSEDRQCYESWRDSELERSRSVYCEGSFGDSRWEWVSEWYAGEVLVLGRWVVLLCFPPHCDTAVSCLTNNTLTTSSSSTDCYDDWHQASPTVHRPSYDASRPFCRGRLPRRFHDASAALRLLLAASYVFWMTFSVVYYVVDSFSVYLLVFSLDTVLIHNW